MKTWKRAASLLTITLFVTLLALPVLPVPAALAAGAYTAKFEAQFNPDVGGIEEWPDLGAAAQVDFDEGESATITLEFENPVAFGGNYAAVNTDFPATGAGGITSFKLDGAEVDMGGAFLNGEGIDGGLRLTICNKWNSDIAEQPVDVETLGEFSKLEITFTVSEGGGADGGGAATEPPVDSAFDPNGTYHAKFEAQFNPDVGGVEEWPDLSAFDVTFKGSDGGTITVEFDGPTAFGGNYAAINTDVPYPGSAGKITSFKLDGAEVSVGAPFPNGEGIDGGLRLTLCNKWNSDIAEQPVDVETLGEFSKIEITFTVEASGELPPQQPAEPLDLPDFEPSGTYHAYLGLQSENFIFRDAWSDFDGFGFNGSGWADYAIGDNFNGMTGWDGNDAVVKPGKFNDCEIKGNGTYTVSVEDCDFENDQMFNLLFFSTDIPLSGDVTFTDVKVKMNGVTKHTFSEGYVPADAKVYYMIQCLNKYNVDLGGADGLFGYTMPVSAIAIEFTVSGFDYDKVETPEDTGGGGTAAPGGATPLPADYVADNAPKNDDGGFPVWAIILCAAGGVAVIGAVVFLVIRKSKKG